MSRYRSIVLVVLGMVMGLLAAQARRPLTLSAQEAKRGVIVTIVGSDPRGNAIYFVSKPSSGACWIGVAGGSMTLRPAPELAGNCQ